MAAAMSQIRLHIFELLVNSIRGLNRDGAAGGGSALGRADVIHHPPILDELKLKTFNGCYLKNGLDGSEEEAYS
jgi:hypothetical protein